MILNKKGHSIWNALFSDCKLVCYLGAPKFIHRLTMSNSSDVKVLK